MIIVYRPEGDGPEQQFDMRRVRASEASIVQKATDMTWAEIRLGVREEDPTALRGVAWVLMKRDKPDLRWGDFDPEIEELRCRYDAREVAEYAADIVGMPEDKQARFIAELRFYAADPDSVDAALAEAAGPPKDLTTETSTPDD